MADPLEGILPPVAEVPAPADPPALDPAEELRQQNARLQSMIEQQGAALNDVRAQLAASTSPSLHQDIQDPNAQFWTDPTANTRAIVQEQIQATINPQAAAINEKLGRFMVQNFLAAKAGDSFYAQVTPIFTKEVAKVPMAALGAAKEADVNNMLDVAWNAALGQYVQAQRLARPVPPPNLGGGGSAGSGPNGKKTLAEIDPQAYNMAMRNGFSAEQMQQIADELQEDN